MTAIAVAHHVPYVAQAASTHWHDLSVKVERAVAAEGPGFLNVLTDCPVGWGHEPRLATGSSTPPSIVLLAALRGGGRPLPAELPARARTGRAWLRSQQRFAHLLEPENAELVRQIQELVDTEWAELLERCEAPS